MLQCRNKLNIFSSFQLLFFTWISFHSHVPEWILLHLNFFCMILIEKKTHCNRKLVIFIMKQSHSNIISIQEGGNTTKMIGWNVKRYFKKKLWEPKWERKKKHLKFRNLCWFYSMWQNVFSPKIHFSLSPHHSHSLSHLTLWRKCELFCCFLSYLIAQTKLRIVIELKKIQ